MKENRWIQYLKSKDVFNMTYNELADWIDYIIEDKKLHHSQTNIQKDVYEHLQIYLRYFRLLINLAKVKGEVANFFIQAMMMQMDKDEKDKIIKLAEELKNEASAKIMRDINLMREEKIDNN